MGIYSINNKANGKRYIGSAVNIGNRWRLHLHQLRHNKHHSIHLQRAFNAYGEENFEIETLRAIDEKTQLVVEEQNYINLHKSYDPLFGYNICSQANSSLGIKRSVAFKEKCRQSKLGPKNSRYGVKLSEETKKKCSLAKSGSNNPMYGKKLSEETKRKIKESLLKNNDGNYPNKGRIGRLCKSSKPILQCKNNQIIKQWDCAADAARELGVSSAHISEVANGKRKSAHGYSWRFV